MMPVVNPVSLSARCAGGQNSSSGTVKNSCTLFAHGARHCELVLGVVCLRARWERESTHVCTLHRDESFGEHAKQERPLTPLSSRRWSTFLGAPLIRYNSIFSKRDVFSQMTAPAVRKRTPRTPTPRNLLHEPNMHEHTFCSPALGLYVHRKLSSP